MASGDVAETALGLATKGSRNPGPATDRSRSGTHPRPSREGIAMDPLNSLRSLDPAKRASSLFDEFKAFAFKRNVIDLAVGVIIGAAFGKIVDSLVKQIIMPLISVIIPSDQKYHDWKWV